MYGGAGGHLPDEIDARLPQAAVRKGAVMIEAHPVVEREIAFDLPGVGVIEPQSIVDRTAVLEAERRPQPFYASAALTDKLVVAGSRDKHVYAFERQTGIPVILNTSFNENEPIVCKPEEAIDCFQRTRMDAIAIGPFVALKSQN